MNCRRIEEMIPLYVGGDLERNRAELVSAHLRSCPGCSNVADQYNESQEWLQSYRPPEPGSAFFDDLKRGVLGKIERQESRPTFFQAVAEHWRWNAVLAAAVLLVIVGGLVFYSSQSQLVTPTDDQAIAVPRRDELTAPKDEAAGPGPERVQQKTTRRPPRRRATPGVDVARLQPKLPDPGTEIPVHQIAESSAVDASLEEKRNPEENTGSIAATTRIEIQTSDPNIRIIWFAPKNPGKPSNRRATDT